MNFLKTELQSIRKIIDAVESQGYHLTGSNIDQDGEPTMTFEGLKGHFSTKDYQMLLPTEPLSLIFTKFDLESNFHPESGAVSSSYYSQKVQEVRKAIHDLDIEELQTNVDELDLEDIRVEISLTYNNVSELHQSIVKNLFPSLSKLFPDSKIHIGFSKADGLRNEIEGHRLSSLSEAGLAEFYRGKIKNLKPTSDLLYTSITTINSTSNPKEDRIRIAITKDLSAQNYYYQVVHVSYNSYSAHTNFVRIEAISEISIKP